ncbi:B3 domain-containing protein REM16-like [Chenopodium quinoa]|uniref:B3 domain-containing protein REM16-like n=1 Tax=Chenopodium quinoa TaxID=63459 RepID=UPI000B779D86|nr:B3 domain-containing protein REM16-like [Chenopodium quinoa]
MAKKCQCCEIKENYHYWLEFPSTNHQFIVIIAHNFLQELKIPQKFIECFKEELSTWCTLIGPNENKWRVKFVSGTKFSDGWEKFVSDHGVEVNDIVVFHYAGDSSFKVSVFDRENGCEREGSHFASNTSTSHKVTCTSTLHFNWADNNNGSSTSTPAPAPAAAAAAAVGSSQKPIVIDEESHDSEYDSAYNAETSEDDEDDQNNSEYQPVWRRRTRARSDYSTTGKTPQLGACFISNRRDPTDKEKERAVEKATEFMEAIQRQNKIQNAPMFQITLKPTHVKHKFLLTIPRKWATEHMVQGTRDVKLQVGNRSWIVGYRWSLRFQTFQHFLNPNWANFVFDNNLEVHDSCVFELIQEGCLPVFNVYIFRAIYNIVPLTRSGFRS